jgi:hypothetical protein
MIAKKASLVYILNRGRILGRNWDQKLFETGCYVNIVQETSSQRTLKIMSENPNELYVHEFGFRLE